MSDFLAEPFDVAPRDGVLVVRARATKLGSMEAEALLEVIYGDAAGDLEQMVIDLTGVEYANSGTLSVLWRASQSHQLRLCGLGHEVEKLLHTMGFLHLLDCDRTLDASLAALAGN